MQIQNRNGLFFLTYDQKVFKSAKNFSQATVLC